MSASEHEVLRHQKKEAYNHELVTSEDFYVSEIEALITHIVEPLSGSATRCNIKEGEIDFVFGILRHILQFHLQFVRIIRDEISVIHSFAHYIGFIAMYSDYFSKYSSMIDIVARWSGSMELREFIKLRLRHDKCAKYIDDRLCSLPWYLYRPLLRIKEYYRFFKDLERITHDSDDEYKSLIKCKNSIKSVCDCIRRSDVNYIKKTRLLEIQLQIFGNTSPIVTDDRYFVYNRMCQIKLNGIKAKKYKHIHLYIFNDGLLWCSKRGQFKKWFGFINTNLVYGIPRSSTSCDAMLFIQYGSMHKSKKKKKKKKYIKHSESASFSLSSKISIIDDICAENEEEDKENDNIIDQMAINHAKPTKKNVLLFVNENARDECLDKIKHTQTKYLRRLEKKRFKEKTKYLSVSFEQSITYSQTEDSSFIDINLNHKPLESHKYNASMSTPTSNITILEQSDDTEPSDHETEHSKSVSIDPSPMPMPNVRALKQSVSTEITTIKEEDEDEDELH